MMPSPTDFIVRRQDGEYRAPDVATLRQWSREGLIPPGTYIYHPVLARWVYAREIEELAAPLPPNVTELAANYRQLVLWVGGQILFGLAAQVFPPFAFLVLVTVIGIMFYAYRTAKSLGSTTAIAWALAMLLPLVNLITLVVLSSKASDMCRTYGIEVGLLGPRV